MKKNILIALLLVSTLSGFSQEPKIRITSNPNHNILELSTDFSKGKKLIVKVFNSSQEIIEKFNYSTEHKNYFKLDLSKSNLTSKYTVKVFSPDEVLLYTEQLRKAKKQ